MVKKKYRQQGEAFSKDIDGITVWFQPGHIYLYNDEYLQKYLSEGAIAKAKSLASDILRVYMSEYKTSLKIEKNSLAAEIIGHYWVDEIVLRFKKWLPIFPFKNVLSFVHRRTHQFDCGEKHIDTNRWLWDIIGKWWL